MDREQPTGRVKCFSHPFRDSVGFCAVCSSALCGECAASVNVARALTCKGKHEKQMLRAHGIKTRHWGARSLFSYFALAVAALFVIWGGG